MRTCLVLALLTIPSFAGELPAFYNEVDRIVWMVKDLDATLSAWKRAGVVDIRESGETQDDATFRGRPTKAAYKWAEGRFAGVHTIWAQPLSGSSAFVEFAKQHGEGVAAVLHRAPSSTDLAGEVKRMQSLGVNVLQRGELGEGAPYVLFDTASEGKYIVGVVYDPTEARPSERKVTQYAFVVRDHAPASRFWARLGWPEMSVTHPSLTDHQYHAKPTTAVAALGWQRHGKVVYEWIIPKPEGSSAWTDQLTRHGEGFHHFGMNVDDMDAAIAQWRKAGFDLTQAGGWGEKGKKGSGRFAYLSSPAGGGADVELLWNFR